MEGQTGTLFIVGACACVLLLGAMRRRAEWLLNFILRAVVGTLAIFFINVTMQKAGMVSLIGLNPVTVLTSGLLGFPGLAMLYGIHFYKTM
ncbi:MAG: pro-sigmaK processing inhibitor BofA family protein [Lachnospiraceae bacterium]|nr:pro-sigmaK processing inhibitor BofA family protein [Lachnospiraceae bacterium]